MQSKLIQSYPFTPPYSSACSRQSTRRPQLQTNQLSAIMSDSWSQEYQTSAYDQVDSAPLFPTASSRQSNDSYPSPASSIPSPSRQAQQDSAIQQDHTMSTANEDQNSNQSYSYADSAVDENRVFSGRLSRLEYRGQRRRDSSQNPYPRTSSGLSPRHYSSSYEATISRPQSPSNSREEQYATGGALSIPSMIQSPNNPNQPYRPMTPNSLTPNSMMSSYGSFDQYPSHPHSQSSHGYSHRPASPALSIVSSRSDFRDDRDTLRDSPERDTLTPLRPKPKKAKLTNALRKEICLYQQQHTHQKQEEIAHRFGVERSTVSKILKEKRTWLNMEDGVDEPPRHRPPKHPKLEEEMVVWLEKISALGETITDAKIQRKALEIAEDLRRKTGSINAEKGKEKDETFKASAGWTENFKRRHHVKGGVWHGRPKPEEPEIDDSPMVNREDHDDGQYIHHHHHGHHSEADLKMDIEGHPDIDAPPLPIQGTPTVQEADNAMRIVTLYLDSRLDEFEKLGFTPEHRDIIGWVYKHLIMERLPPT